MRTKSKNGQLTEREVLTGYLQRERAENRKAEDLYNIGRTYDIIANDSMRNSHIINKQTQGEMEMTKLETNRTNAKTVSQEVMEDVRASINEDLRIPEASYNVDLKKLQELTIEYARINVNSRFINIHEAGEKLFKICYNSIEIAKGVELPSMDFSNVTISYTQKYGQKTGSFIVCDNNTPVFAGQGWIWTCSHKYERKVNVFGA